MDGNGDGSRGTQASAPAWSEAVPHVLWRAHHAVHRLMQQAVGDLGVTVTQLGLAVHLDESGRLSASDLARRFHLTPQSVTTALGQLERLGWVRRLPHPAHKRVIWYELSEAGLRNVAEGQRRTAAARAVVDEILGAGRDGVVAELRKLIVALEGEDDTGAPMWPES